MSGFYPFDVKPETFYEKGDFEVVYGFSGSMGGWRVGMRWESSIEGKNGYPVFKKKSLVIRYRSELQGF